MTPKKKADELFNEFCYEIRTEERGDGYFTNVIQAKQCTLIAVDEILKALESDNIIYGSEYRFEENNWWQQVKKEIENL
tara:strand:+ start:252 stop:488 length:237 start_codon:yes stop_codon:yes gene_type:complete